MEKNTEPVQRKISGEAGEMDGGSDGEKEALTPTDTEGAGVIKKLGMTKNLAVAVFLCAAGSSFQFGYNTGVVNAPQEVIEHFIGNTYEARYQTGATGSFVTMLWSLIVAIFAIGGMIGGSMAGGLSNKLGRKGAMLANNIIVIIGGVLVILSKFCKSYEMFIASRLVIGVNAGINTVIAPTYLAEIAPTRLRGTTGTINQFAIVCGILVSQILGLSWLLGNDYLWPVLFGLTLAPAVLQLMFLPMCPESPRYLYLFKLQTTKAQKALVWLRGAGNIEEDMNEMKKEFRAEHSGQEIDEKIQICGIMKKRSTRIPMIVCAMLMLSQQLSGINAIFYYSTSIFKSAGMSLALSQFATIMIGAVNVAMTFVSVILIDRLGRRKLHLYGLGGMWMFSIILTTALLWVRRWPFMSYLSVAAVMMFVVSFAAGPGAIPWFYPAEMFSQANRAAAMSNAVLINWMANFAIGMAFPSMQKSLGDYSFLPFAGLLAFFWLFCYYCLPETKGRSIEEITTAYKRLDEEEDPEEQKGYQRVKNKDSDSPRSARKKAKKRSAKPAEETSAPKTDH